MLPFLGYLTLNDIVTLKSRLQVTQGHSNRYHSKAWVRFLLAFRSNYGSISHNFQARARYLSTILIFSYSLAFDAPVRGYPSEYCHPVWFGKTRMVELPDGEKSLRIIMCRPKCNRLDTIPTCDRQTDGQRTNRHLATA